MHHAKWNSGINAPCHTAFSVTKYVTSKGIPMVPQPSYSPDLSPCDFYLFSKPKNVLKGLHFALLENVQKSVMDMLKTIAIEDFRRCYQQWEQRLRRCVAARTTLKKITLIFEKNKNFGT